MTQNTEPVKSFLEALTLCHNPNLPNGIRESVQIQDDDADADTEELEIARNPELYSPWLDACTTSPANLVLAKVWLRNCIRNHTPYGTYSQSYLLPRRVIDVRNPQQPYLCFGEHQTGQYVTLSYKWGDSKKIVTSSDNYQEHLQGISPQKLPWTFKEAIQVTHDLGFQYLWIDAICIIQDSKVDVQDGIGSMDKIYRNSTLTIFAAAGDNTDAGVSIFRDPRSNKTCKLDLKTTAGGQNSQGSLYVTLDHPGDERRPLYERGWVLQEEVLSTRSLVFGSRQLSWRCLCAGASEKHPEGSAVVQTIQELGRPQYEAWRDYSRGTDGFEHLRLWLLEKDPIPDRVPWQRDNQFDAWYEMVTSYSLRSLIFSTDVLQALAGISALVHKHECTYLAGLWKEDLQIGLEWYVVKNDADYGRGLNKSPASFPTWSWVSQWGKYIEFRGWENNSVHAVEDSLKFVSGGNAQPLNTLNPFGEVTNKQLTLSGLLRKDSAVSKTYLEMRSWQEGNGHNLSERCRWLEFVRDPETSEEIWTDCSRLALRDHSA